MNAGIPKVARAADALRRLEQSRVLWHEWRARPSDARVGVRFEEVPGKYSYVRAHQRTKDRVDFTLFVVDAQDRVSLRALISTDPARLAGAPLSKMPTWRSFESHWVERGAEVSRHEDGAAARSIDGLYDDCATLIRQHPSAPARLFFHPDGVLMQCGFAADDCSGCGEVSVQGYTHFPVDAAVLSDDPAKWVCGTAWGVFLPGSPIPLVDEALSCMANTRAPHVRLLPLGPLDVCGRDLHACPDRHPDGDSFWERTGHACARVPDHYPGALDVGKAEPRGPWRFKLPEQRSIECNDD